MPGFAVLHGTAALIYLLVSLLAVGLLAAVFGFPTNFALRWMIPGTAIGVLVGVRLLFAGITMLTMGTAVRQAAR